MGILGGTFNPPHRGHLALASYARSALGLDRVLLMPAHTSPHKQEAPDPGAAQRLRMCELAAAAEPGVQACALEVERGGTSYTVETLRRIRARHPQAPLTLIVGADVAAGLPTWREPAEILRLARLAVVARAGVDRDALGATLADLSEARAEGAADDVGAAAGADASAAEFAFLDMPPVAVSSSMVRERIAAAEPIDGLVPAAVAGYIADHGLYRDGR